MSIDWIRAEETPSKPQKVEGRFLLDLRAKINDLEKQLTIKRDEVSKLNSNLTDKDREFKSLNERIDSSNSQLDEIKKEKVNILVEVAQNTKDKEQLDGKLAETEKNLKEAEAKIKEIEPKVGEAESLQKELEAKDEEIAAKDKQIENLKSGGADVEELKKKLADTELYLQTKVQAVNDLNDKMNAMEGAPKIIDEIKKKMSLQGFLNEKDFDDLISKI